MIWTLKCRDCQFKTKDVMEVYEHIDTLGHKDYSLMEGTTVKVDWLQIEMEVIREAPGVDS